MIHWCAASVMAAATVWLALRFLARRCLENEEHILYVDEFAGNIFSGAFIMEIGIIASEYGDYSVTSIAFGFIMLLIRNSYFTYESLCSFVDVYYSSGRKYTFTFMHFLANVLCQISGMVLGQWLARAFWAFEDHSHAEALKAVCETAISTSHPLPYAVGVEFLGPFTMCLAAYYVSSVLRLSRLVPLIVTTVAYINFYLVTHITGSFYNQSMATAFTFQCKGHKSDWEFFVVYWIAPTLGSIVAWELLLAGEKFVKGEKSVGKSDKKNE